MKQLRSGAHIIVNGGRVTKIGVGEPGVRVGKQGKWLWRYAMPELMPVTAVTDRSYVMPVCDDWWVDDAAHDIFTAIAVRADTGLWRKPPSDAGVDIRLAYAIKVETLSHAVEFIVGRDVAYAMKRYIDIIDWDALPRCLTHGDLTFSNAMRMWDGEIVLCDPLPSVITGLGDVRAIDIGKLLQSCLGWDRDFEELPYSGEPDPQWASDLCASGNERAAVKAYCLLHLARILPYTSGDEAEKLIPYFKTVRDL